VKNTCKRTATRSCEPGNAQFISVRQMASRSYAAALYVRPTALLLLLLLLLL